MSSGNEPDAQSLDYIVAVRTEGSAEFFGFPTKEDRALFIADIVELDPDVQYATTEQPRSLQVVQD